MQKNNFNNIHVSYIPKEQRIQNTSNRFTQQSITYDDTPLFFPSGLEKLFLLVYFICLPYVTGLLFLFFYVSEGNTKVFFSLNEKSSFILTWAIGYEIIASILLLGILKSAISFSLNKSRGINKNFQKP